MIGFLGEFVLMRSDGPEGKKDCRVGGNAVIQQGSDNLLDQGDEFGGEQR